jgi:hypothetical protein
MSFDCTVYHPVTCEKIPSTPVGLCMQQHSQPERTLYYLFYRKNKNIVFCFNLNIRTRGATEDWLASGAFLNVAPLLA